MTRLTAVNNHGSNPGVEMTTRTLEQTPSGPGLGIVVLADALLLKGRQAQGRLMRDFIHEYPSAISQDVCARLVQKFEYYEKNPGKQILVQDKFTTDGGLPNEKRTKEASVIYLNPEILQSEDADFFRLIQFCIEGMSRCISSYISALQPISIAPIQVDQVDLMRYERGQGFYGRHVDAGSRALQHRVLSFVAYLNDVEKGGETEFPLQGRIVKPETGKVVVFPSSFCFLHGSKMTISGQKYVLVAFSSFGM